MTGQPWGALEELLLGQKITPGLTFSLPKVGDPTYVEAQPWMELLQEVCANSWYCTLLTTAWHICI